MDIVASIVAAGPGAPVEQVSIVSQFGREQQCVGRRRIGSAITDGDRLFAITGQRPDCVRESWDLFITACVGNGACDKVLAKWWPEVPAEREAALSRTDGAVLTTLSLMDDSKTHHEAIIADDQPARNYADSSRAEEKQILAAKLEAVREIRSESDRKFGRPGRTPLTDAGRGPALKRGS